VVLAVSDVVEEMLLLAVCEGEAVCIERTNVGPPKGVERGAHCRQRYSLRTA